MTLWPQATRRRLLLIALAGSILLVLATTSVLAATLQLKGKSISAVRTVTTDALSSTRSQDFVNVPGLSATIGVPSRQKALLIITVSGESSCWANYATYCYLRVLVDGAEAAPGAVVFDSVPGDSNTTEFQDYAWHSNSAQFVAGPLGSGQHTVTVQWRVKLAYTGDPDAFRLLKRTLTVLRSRT